MVDGRNDSHLGVPVEVTLKVIGGKWKGTILFHLLTETIRFNELRRLMPEVTQRMLTKQLRELEAVDVISRKVYPVVPSRVEYSITEYGKTLAPVIHTLHVWGVAHIERIEREGEQ